MTIQLDWFENSKAYVLSVPRWRGDLIDRVMREHGFDFSTASSNADTAVLYTREPFAAATFINNATLPAALRLSPIADAVADSWRKDGDGATPAIPAGKQLWPFQVAGIQYALGRKNTLIGDQPGLGKAQPLGAKILTPSGVEDDGGHENWHVYLYVIWLPGACRWGL